MNKKSFHTPFPWITAALGLAVMVVNFINGSMLNSFLKKQPMPLDHAYMRHFPAEELLFLIGLMLCIGGIIAGLQHRRNE